MAAEGIVAAPIYFAQAAGACAVSDCADKTQQGLQTLPNVSDLKLSDTVAQHANDLTRKGDFARPYINSNLVVQEIMNAAPGVTDPQGAPNAILWRVPGAFKGSQGTWELVVNVKDNVIVHFLFQSNR